MIPYSRAFRDPPCHDPKYLNSTTFSPFFSLCNLLSVFHNSSPLTCLLFFFHPTSTCVFPFHTCLSIVSLCFSLLIFCALFCLPFCLITYFKYLYFFHSTITFLFHIHLIFFSSLAPSYMIIFVLLVYIPSSFFFILISLSTPLCPSYFLPLLLRHRHTPVYVLSLSATYFLSSSSDLLL